jgi:dUTP pyrophosphatase
VIAIRQRDTVRGVVDIPTARLGDGALPAYAHPGDAGADLVANSDVELAPRGGRALVPTGIAVAIPDGYAGLVLARSGLAVNHGVTCLNAPGLIDSGFRGELQIVLVNTDPETAYFVHRGDRLAQLVIVPVEVGHFVETEQLPPSSRGKGGFGHSGR